VSPPLWEKKELTGIQRPLDPLKGGRIETPTSVSVSSVLAARTTAGDSWGGFGIERGNKGPGLWIPLEY